MSLHSKTLHTLHIPQMLTEIITKSNQTGITLPFLYIFSKLSILKLISLVHLVLLKSNNYFLRKKITESQNYRMGKLERTTGCHLAPPPCSSRVILDHMAQDFVQMVLEYHPWGRLQNLSGQSVPVHSHPHVDKVLSCKNVFY